jgi:CelD/BcsL family acetyltransferase involved in cellulose biosynthesis
MRMNLDTEKNIQVKVFDSFDELAPLQKEWDDFIERASEDIFLTYDWCRVWWKYYGKGRELSVFVFRDNENLVGIIPIFSEKIRLGPTAVKAAKIVGSDFTPIQFRLPLMDNYMPTVIKKFSELISKHNFDIIHIGPIAGLYDHFDELKDCLTECFGGSHLVSAENNNVQCYFRLTESWEKYLSALNGSERRNIRRNENKLQKMLSERKESLVTNFADEDSFPEYFGDFVGMHQSYWQKQGQMGHFEDWPFARAFHQEAASLQLKRGRLRLLQLRAAGHTLCYGYGFKFGNMLIFFIDAHSAPELFTGISIGQICFGAMTKKAILENIGWVDSMRGNYEHKRRLGGQFFPVKSIYVIPRKASIRLRTTLFRFCARLLNLFYYRIWFCRIALKAPFTRRALWKIWIRTNFFA